MSYQEDKLAEIAESLRAKKGTDDKIVANDFWKEILKIPTLTSEIVTFYDYDGSIVAKITLEEISFITDDAELPKPPEHDRLIFQGWNWSLADIKSLGKSVKVGAMYGTVSGKSEFDLTLTNVTGLDVTMRFANKSVLVDYSTFTIDWGDGTPQDVFETKQGSGIATFTHTYSDMGNYTVSVDGTSEYRMFGIPSTAPHNMFNVSPSYICTAVRFGDRCTDVGQSAFYNCYSLKSVTMSKTVNMSSSHTFYHCYSLKSITLPNKVRGIDPHMFQNCYNLTEAIFPKGFTIVYYNAFQNCYNLRSAMTHTGKTNNADNMFQNCYSLTDAAISTSVGEISTTIPQYMFQNCYSLKKITIPDKIAIINTCAFQNCYSLEEIIFPDSVTNIASSICSNCHGLKNVVLSNNAGLSTGVFQNCYSLTEIIIPIKVGAIPSNAFQNCFGMKKYKFLSPVPPTLQNINAFTGVNGSCIIEVPKGSLEAYQTATNWSTYANHMREAEE